MDRGKQRRLYLFTGVKKVSDVSVSHLRKMLTGKDEAVFVAAPLEAVRGEIARSEVSVPEKAIFKIEVHE